MDVKHEVGFVSFRKGEHKWYFSFLESFRNMSSRIVRVEVTI